MKPKKPEANLKAYKQHQMKNNKTKVKLYASLIVLLLVGVIAIGYGVKAYNSDSPKVVVEGDYIEAVPVSEDTLGAVSSQDNMGSLICLNDDCTYHLQQTFQDATTTILAMTDPFLMATTSAYDVVVTPSAQLVNGLGQTGATSTVELVRLNITGAATSTYTISCGASATNGANGDGTQVYSILYSDSIPTSTLAVVENNVGSTSGTPYGGGSTAKIMLGPTYPYLVCKVTSLYTGAFTEASNTFAGTGMVRISKTRL